jgi:type I restriction enzyme, S subunit
MEDWRRVKLADVAALDVDRIEVDPDEEYAAAGVLIAGRGLFWREPLRGTETNYSTLQRLRAGQIVYRKLTAWEGPITVVPAEFDGAFVSSEFPTFSLDESKILPTFMRLICSQPSFHDQMRLRSTGTAERRNRLKPSDLMEIEIPLPPLDDQGRIVAAASAFESVLVALELERRAAERLLSAMQTDRFESLEAGVRRVAEFTRVVSGGTPTRQHPEYFGGGIPWVKSGDIVFNDLYTTPETITSAGVQNSAAKYLPAGTVVVAMYGQGATRGRCAILREEMTTNQACAGILPSSNHDPEFLFHWLWSRYHHLRDQYDGTSQPNLSKRLIEDLRPPLPALTAQRAIAAELGAILDVVRELSAEYSAAEDARSGFVAAMLDRQVVIDDVADLASSR